MCFVIVNRKVRHSGFSYCGYFNPDEAQALSLQPSYFTAMSTTVVSAPGKVLLAGGYLILDPKYSGIVVSTSSRFYSVVSSASTPGAIVVNSPQFANAVWKYSVGPNCTVEAEYVAEGSISLAHHLIGPL